MAKILCWNVPKEYREAMEKEARRLAPEVEIEEVRDLEELEKKIEVSDRPFTHVVAFGAGMSPYRLGRLIASHEADFMGGPELPSLADFIAEFNRTFHPWKK